MKKWNTMLFLGAGLLAFLFTSCRSIGPKTIQNDGFNYNARIAHQQNEQILFNIVRLRYAEVPLFLNVNSVINQYSRDARAGVGGTNLLGTPAAGADVNAGWSDRPTITYTPMGGQAFSQSLLTPLTPSSVFFLIQSGWSAERMLRLTCSSINGLRNEVATPAGRRQAQPEFMEMVELMEDLRREEALGMQVVDSTAERTINVFFPENPENDTIRSNILRFKQLLGLNASINSFPIRYGQIMSNDREIVVHTSSMLDIMFNLSWYMEVPPEHVAEGRTYDTFRSDQRTLLAISSSESKPRNGLSQIKTRDHWYYVDDRDLSSKTTLAVVQILMSLSSSGQQNMAPLISIGN